MIEIQHIPVIIIIIINYFPAKKLIYQADGGRKWLEFAQIEMYINTNPSSRIFLLLQ